MRSELKPECFAKIIDHDQQFRVAGGVGATEDLDAKLVELIELRDHPWFLACQYHPEFLSKPNSPHPLFRGFIAACLANSE